MKKVSSLRILKKRDKDCKIVKRTKTRRDGSKKKVSVVINKQKGRYKATQG